MDFILPQASQVIANEKHVDSGCLSQNLQFVRRARVLGNSRFQQYFCIKVRGRLRSSLGTGPWERPLGQLIKNAYVDCGSV